VTKIEPYSKDDPIVVLASGARLPVSRSGSLRLEARLEQKSAIPPPLDFPVSAPQCWT